jgi:hypothetical protein
MFLPYNLGNHQALMNITQVIEINGYDMNVHIPKHN